MSIEIFDKHPEADAYRIGGAYQPYAIVGKDKRFSEAELCAEFEAARCDYLIHQATGTCWTPLGDTWPMDAESIWRRTSTLLRFASLPHFDA